MIKRILLILSIGTVATLSGCGSSEEDMGEVYQVTKFAPVPVEKTEEAKVFVHLMPWFETKETNGGTNWGQHWTMANQNPDVIVDAASGKRQIASHFYPLIGPYASSDRDVIEYQLLLMKFSGIDGVLIDWYGTINLYDYPANLRNAEAFIALVEQVGLQYALVYEDQTIKAALDADKITDKVAAAQADMSYMSGKYFSESEYAKVDGKPLLLTFGPQTFQTSSEWTSVFSVLSNKPKFLTLWNESGEAGANASGEYSWVYQNDVSHLTHLDNFYNKAFTGMKMGSVYPGFKDFYNEGNWGDGYFEIEHNATGTFEATLDKALASDVDYIQVVTWNDYGEGTMIEPTVEFGYSFLTMLQSKLGTSTEFQDFNLVNRLFSLRKANKNSTLKQKKLDQVFYYIVSMQKDKATELMDTL
jgi:hypothetical protein